MGHVPSGEAKITLENGTDGHAPKRAAMLIVKSLNCKSV